MDVGVIHGIYTKNIKVLININYEGVQKELDTLILFISRRKQHYTFYLFYYFQFYENIYNISITNF